MAMYAVAITPLIHRLAEERLKQVWWADDASAAGKLSSIKNWWNNISEIGPEYGYFPNAGKTWLIVKETHFEEAKRVFQDTGLTISKEGKRHLGSAIGTRSFVESYVEEKVSKWKEELERASLRNCYYTTTSCLCRVYSWFQEQVDLFGLDNPEY